MPGRKKNAQFTYVQQIRLSPQQVEEIDAWIAKRQEREPLLCLSRSDAIRFLLDAALHPQTAKEHR